MQSHGWYVQHTHVLEEFYSYLGYAVVKGIVER